MVAIFSVINKVVAISFQKGLTLPEMNISPKNGWLEDDPFLLGLGLCSGAMLVSQGGKCSFKAKSKLKNETIYIIWIISWICFINQRQVTTPCHNSQQGWHQQNDAIL